MFLDELADECHRKGTSGFISVSFGSSPAGCDIDWCLENPKASTGSYGYHLSAYNQRSVGDSMQEEKISWHLFFSKLC